VGGGIKILPRSMTILSVNVERLEPLLTRNGEGRGQTRVKVKGGLSVGGGGTKLLELVPNVGYGGGTEQAPEPRPNIEDHDRDGCLCRVQPTTTLSAALN